MRHDAVYEAAIILAGLALTRLLPGETGLLAGALAAGLGTLLVVLRVVGRGRGLREWLLAGVAVGPGALLLASALRPLEPTVAVLGGTLTVIGVVQLPSSPLDRPYAATEAVWLLGLLVATGQGLVRTGLRETLPLLLVGVGFLGILDYQRRRYEPGPTDR